MRPSTWILAAAILSLGAANSGCRGSPWFYWDTVYVKRIYVEPYSPRVDTEALVFVEYVDTLMRVDCLETYGVGPLEIAVSAGTLSEVTGAELRNLIMNHSNAGWVFSWQTPGTPQIVTIQASLPDGGRSIKVEVRQAE